MSAPNLSSYQKIFDTFLPIKFPKIDHIVVREPSHSLGLRSLFVVDVYLKSFKDKNERFFCNEFVLGVEKEIRTLNPYIENRRGIVDIIIYSSDGKVLCTNYRSLDVK